jgi:hypothetical protein
MFWNKKPTVKQKVTLTHRDGEVVTITIEGTNQKQVDYVNTRIKTIFNMTPNEKMPSQEEMDKFWGEAEKVFKSFSELFKH